MRKITLAIIMRAVSLTFILGSIFMYWIRFLSASSDYIPIESALFIKQHSRWTQKNHMEHQCTHSALIRAEKRLKYPEQSYKKLGEQGGTKSHPKNEMKPIRIHFDFSQLDSISEAVREYIMFDLIPSIDALFEGFLSVEPISGPLKVDPFYLNNTCGVPKIEIPPSHINNGVEDTDLIIYISALFENTPSLAQSSFCPQGDGFGLSSGRPTVAYFNMNLKQLRPDVVSDDPAKLTLWIQTAVHELTHALVMSPDHFHHFQIEEQPFKIVDGKTYINATEIVELARNHFGCEEINTVPMEDEDGESSTSVHWERRLFGNELMTGSVTEGSILSEFTAKMYEISGWYGVNYEMIGSLLWGKKKGCQFFKECDQAEDHLFCQGSGSRCSFDYTAVAECKADKLANQCSYWRPIESGWCNDPDKKMKDFYNDYGGSAGKQNDRCWNSNRGGQKNGQSYGALCFHSDCDYEDGEAVQASVKVYGKWYHCNRNTGKIITKNGYEFECPDLDVFCEGQPACINQCSARGVCHGGRCHCYEGFYGKDCSHRTK